MAGTYNAELGAMVGEDSNITTKFSRKTTVSFSPETMIKLDELATSSGKNKVRIIRDAVALEILVQSAIAEGGKVILEMPNGKRRVLWMR